MTIENVVDVANLPTEMANKTRRFKWSNSINEAHYKTYLQITPKESLVNRTERTV